MNVLVVSGIWPPDVGGPASHAPDVASFLQSRGHDVDVVITGNAPPEPQPYPIHLVSRALPKGVVHVRVLVEIARRARSADVVYSTGMFTRTAAACALTHRSYVLKLTGDPAFERARWRGRVGGDIETFQHRRDFRLLRALRNATVRHAAHVVCPSASLAALARKWGARSVSVLPNPVPRVPPATRRVHDGIVLAFAGRFGPQKSLDVLFDAVDRVPGVRLLVAGDGDLQARPGNRVELLGPLAREDVLRLFADADASVLSSSWENFPHALVEALAVGTPVIATSVGGVPEIVEDGRNGLLVPPNDVEALAAAIRRFSADPELRERLRAGAAPSVERFAREAIFETLEQILVAAAK